MFPCLLRNFSLSLVLLRCVSAEFVVRYFVFSPRCLVLWSGMPSVTMFSGLPCGYTVVGGIWSPLPWVVGVPIVPLAIVGRGFDVSERDLSGRARATKVSMKMSKLKTIPKGGACPPFGNWIPQTQDLPKSTGSYCTHVLC